MTELDNSKAQPVSIKPATWNDTKAAEPAPIPATPGVYAHEEANRTLNQYQTVNVQCTHAKREIYKIKEYIDKMTHKDAQARALELFDRAYQAFDRLQAFIGSRG